MADVRKKLIEILRVPIFPHVDADPAEVVADYLLDNGVTFATDNNVGHKQRFLFKENGEVIPLDRQWIPVTERLPERFVYVLVMTNWGEAAVARVKGNGRWYIGWDNDRCDDVTHWMPLPEPPKGD